MELLPKDSILEFNPDTLQYLRKLYYLDQPGRIEEAVDLLNDWIQKQPHFMKKDFARDYLERTIIISKGSVERAKKKLDKICTFRTLYPEIFGVHDIKNFESLKDMHCAFLPKLTQDHYRIHVFRSHAKTLSKGFIEFYQYFAAQCEYIQAHDYCSGLLVLQDYRQANILETVKVLNINQMQRCLAVTKDGYGMRIKGFHFLTDSTALEAVVSLFKQAFGSKLSGRILCHSSLETLYEYIPKDILPVDYGGKEKSLWELHKQYQDVLTTKEFTDYLTEINKACTDEDLRLEHNNDCLGLPGSFRKLTVD